MKRPDHIATSAPRRPQRSFERVETWVFDLDNTLYPHHLNLWQQVDERIRDYIARFLDVTHEEAFRLQKDYYWRYGTSMRGLMTEHGMEPDDFLKFVHQIDHSPLTPNPALGAALEKLAGRKLILTNGTRAHADAVVRRLGIHEHFEDVFDIVAAELEPKPLVAAYDRFLARHGVDPNKRHVRGSGAQSREAACARHDDGAGGARRHARSLSRGLGARRPRCAARRSCDRRSRRLPGAAWRTPHGLSRVTD
jgi:putative hydrolase of the HAD superfamily